MTEQSTATEKTELQFDAATHTYTVDGRVLPSVTQILRAVGCVDERWYTEEGRQRGEAVDILTECHDRGTLDYPKAKTEYPQYIGYLHAWTAFRCETKFQVADIQLRVWTSRDGYAGTLDRTGLFEHRRFENGLVDIKSGQPEWWHPLQTMAYAHCDGSCDWVRGCVYLRSDGTYKWIEHTDPADEPAWLNAVALYHYRKNKGGAHD